MLRSSPLCASALRFSQQSVRPGFVAPALQYQQQRNAASLKELKKRMSTIKVIQKVTASMNKIATSKLKAARTNMEKIAAPVIRINMEFLKGKGMEEHTAEENIPPRGEKELLMVVTSDRGLCGVTNSGILRNIRDMFIEYRRQTKFVIVVAGSKGTLGMKRDFGKFVHTTVQELGKRHLSFTDVEPLLVPLEDVTDYDRVRIISNKWESVVSSHIVHRFLPNPKNMVAEMKEAYYGYEYDEADEAELFQNLQEHLIASIIYGSLIENTAVELAARMKSMDNATNNAADIFRRVSRTYNRTRQANITTELSEIIAGASSVAEQHKS